MMGAFEGDGDAESCGSSVSPAFTSGVMMGSSETFEVAGELDAVGAAVTLGSPEIVAEVDELDGVGTAVTLGSPEKVAVVGELDGVGAAVTLDSSVNVEVVGELKGVGVVVNVAGTSVSTGIIGIHLYPSLRRVVSPLVSGPVQCSM